MGESREFFSLKICLIYCIPQGTMLSILCVCVYTQKGNPLQYSCQENPMDGGAWWATVHGVAKSRIRLSDFTSLHICITGIHCVPETNTAL